MNKIFKAIAIVGNVSEVIIASAMVADLISKLRGINTASKSTPLAEETPKPDQPIAA